MQHPFQYILKKYIQPLGIDQAELRKDLVIGAKALRELYNHQRGITPLTALKFGKYFNIPPELLIRMQAEYDLAQTYDKNKEIIDKINIHNHRLREPKPEKNSKPRMLISTINKSVGDKSKHYTEKELEQLFTGKRLTNRKKYFLNILFSEASAQDVLDFVKMKNIPVENLRHLYEVYLKNINVKRNPCFDWLFKDISKTD
ncbi:Toxin-antitoxin system, antitoxin component [Desulfonema limicola]|uniref:Toxin-antitoxin system, antitoxin component n=1 Tax=Desulfonema limicola TaxID=45656 RepID=A0A975BAD6_9BACT|nr:HigA family addiction module antitoxin [Desulfonema limicola]QTA81515.1 Toxin-antitoxin system, antitoxin component [Desulfonema limicola]